MIVLRLALQSLRNRWLTAMLTVFAIAVSIMLLLGVEKVRDRRAAELRRHHLRHRPDRRRAQRQPPAAALLRLSHRQRHQQHHLAELPGHRRAPRDRLGRAAVARRQPPRLSRARHHARLLQALQVPPDARPRLRLGSTVRRSLRCRDRRRCRGSARLQGRRPHHHLARAGRRLLRRARRQAVPRRRASWRRPARRSTAPCTSAWRPSRRSTSTGRAAARIPGPIRFGRRGAPDGPQAEGDHGRADRPEVEARHLPPAARPSTSTGRSRCRRSCRELPCRSCGGSSARPRRP